MRGGIRRALCQEGAAAKGTEEIKEAQQAEIRR